MPAIAISSITIDASTQPRAETREKTIAEYAERMSAGDTFPPISLVSDGTSYWPSDGLHRLLAAKRNGATEIEANVTPGTKRDATFAACCANTAHGEKRSNADKTRAITILLEDPEWRKLSDSRIAELTRVSNHKVRDLRAELFPESAADPIRIDKNGRAINTANQGGKKRPKFTNESAITEALAEAGAEQREVTEQLAEVAPAPISETNVKPTSRSSLSSSDVVPEWRKPVEGIKSVAINMPVDALKELHMWIGNLLKSKAA